MFKVGDLVIARDNHYPITCRLNGPATVQSVDRDVIEILLITPPEWCYNPDGSPQNIVYEPHQPWPVIAEKFELYVKQREYNIANYTLPTSQFADIPKRIHQS